MYPFKVFVRSIFLWFISSALVNAAYALEAKDTSVDLTKYSTIATDFHRDGSKSNPATSDYPPASQMRDLNADGILDFVTTHTNPGGVSIALGRGNGKFEQSVNYLSNHKPVTVRIRDVNKDNTLDLVAYNFKQKTISVLFGDGNGSFTEQKIYRLNSVSGSQISLQNHLTPSPGTSAAAEVVPKASAPVVTGIAALERSVHQKINAYRKSKGLPPLALNATISNVARRHSQNMASGKVAFGHQGFDARVQTLSKTFTFRGAGENVAYNFGFSDPVAIAVNGWLSSPGHLSNIVGSYNLTGIGVARNTKGEYFFTQIFWRQ